MLAVGLESDRRLARYRSLVIPSGLKTRYNVILISSKLKL